MAQDPHSTDTQPSPIATAIRSVMDGPPGHDRTLPALIAAAEKAAEAQTKAERKFVAVALGFMVDACTLEPGLAELHHGAWTLRRRIADLEHQLATVTDERNAFRAQNEEDRNRIAELEASLRDATVVPAETSVDEDVFSAIGVLRGMGLDELVKLFRARAARLRAALAAANKRADDSDEECRMAQERVERLVQAAKHPAPAELLKQIEAMPRYAPGTDTTESLGETYARMWPERDGSYLLREEVLRAVGSAATPPTSAVTCHCRHPALAAQAEAPKCAICGDPATCIGRYESMTEDDYACDGCCGHGQEDGHCTRLESAPDIDDTPEPEPDVTTTGPSEELLHAMIEVFPGADATCAGTLQGLKAAAGRVYALIGAEHAKTVDDLHRAEERADDYDRALNAERERVAFLESELAKAVDELDQALKQRERMIREKTEMRQVLEGTRNELSQAREELARVSRERDAWKEKVHPSVSVKHAQDLCTYLNDTQEQEPEHYAGCDIAWLAVVALKRARADRYAANVAAKYAAEAADEAREKLAEVEKRLAIYEPRDRMDKAGTQPAPEEARGDLAGVQARDIVEGATKP